MPEGRERSDAEFARDHLRWATEAQAAGDWDQVQRLLLYLRAEGGDGVVSLMRAVARRISRP